MGERSEEALMMAYAGGERRAFEDLFARVAPRVHAFFMRSFRDRAIADDLLQVTFLKVHRARADYQPARPLRPWLFKIAARVRLDELRRRYRLPEGAGEDELARADEERAAERRDGDPAETADRAAVIRAALERLPESQRVAVYLHHYEGMTFGEVAEVLGSTEGAVKLRAFRAYERLRNELGPLLAEEEAA